MVSLNNWRGHHRFEPCGATGPQRSHRLVQSTTLKLFLRFKYLFIVEKRTLWVTPIWKKSASNTKIFSGFPCYTPGLFTLYSIFPGRLSPFAWFCFLESRRLGLTLHTIAF